MQSKAKTVEEYLASLPADRRAAISAVRKVILDNLDKDYEEGMSYGAIGYYVPHRVYPPGYHCDPRLPLPFAGLGSQKHHMALGIMSNYGGSAEEKRFRAAWLKTGKKLDMGKCCVRFKKLEDVPLEVVGESIRRMPAKKFIEQYEKRARPSASPRRRTPRAQRPKRREEEGDQEGDAETVSMLLTGRRTWGRRSRARSCARCNRCRWHLSATPVRTSTCRSPFGTHSSTGRVGTTFRRLMSCCGIAHEMRRA